MLLYAGKDLALMHSKAIGDRKEKTRAMAAAIKELVVNNTGSGVLIFRH